MIILTGVILLSAIAVEGIIKNCDNGTILYRDIGCKPSCQKEKESGCPLYYKCNEYELKNDTCLFRGIHYNAGENINTTDLCGDCICSADYNEENKIQTLCFTTSCAIIQRGDYLAVRSIDSCCSEMSKNITANTIRCISDGTTYFEGEKFLPSNSCLQCFCEKGYKSYQAPFCRRINCNVEINYSEQILKKCAPIYPQGMKCCPSHFLCPEDIQKTVNIKLELDASVEKQNNQCSFGSRRMAIGGSFVAQVSTVNWTCTCDVPPLVTCTA